MRCTHHLWVLGLVWVGLLWGCSAKPPAPPDVAAEAQTSWLGKRMWTAADGRTLEGALAARMGDAGVVLRAVDGVPLRLPARLLNAENAKFLNDAMASGVVPTTLADVWHLRTKFTIPGGEAYMMPDSASSIGPRIAKTETSYWLLLSELDGSDAKWARVDVHAFSKLSPDTLVRRGELAKQLNGAGNFLDQVACPRTDFYVIDARYGLTSQRVNVTRAMMGVIASGGLPVTVGPELFGMPGHAPDVWDLTLTWQRAGEGTLNRVVRDGSILAWP